MVLCNSNPRKLIQRVLEIITVKILWGSEKSQDKKKIKFWSFQDRVLKECEDRWGKEKRLREMAKKSNVFCSVWEYSRAGGHELSLLKGQ